MEGGRSEEAGGLDRWGADRFFRYLRDAEQRGERFAFLVGSGASRSAGIPTGGELVRQWVPRLAGQFGVEAAGAADWAVQNLDGYDPDNPGSYYGPVIDRLFPTPAARRIEIDRLCRGRNPGFGYGVLSSLMARESGAFNIALTTNFDDLLTDALYVFQGEHPLVIGEDRLADYIDPSSSQTLIVKLHGAYQMRPRNTPEEIAQLDAVMYQRVGSLLLGRGLVVIGYGGNDPSVEALLQGLPESAIPSGVWWTSREPPAPRFDGWLRDRHTRWVQADDFDALMFSAFVGFDLDPPTPSRVSSIFDSWESSYRALSGRPPSEESGFEQARRDLARRPEERWHSDLSALATILAEQDTAARESLYHEAIDRFPRSPRLLGSYASFLYHTLRDLDAAEEAFTRAVEADPNHSDNLSAYAWFLAEGRRDYERAAPIYERALAADPHHAATLGRYAVFLRVARDDLQATREMFERAIAADPNNAVNLSNFGWFLAHDMGDLDAAEATLLRALEIDPNNPGGLGNHAAFLDRYRGDPDAAEAAFRRAVDARPDDVANLGGYALFLARRRADLDGAAAMYDRALAADPEDGITLGNYALLEFERDRVGEGRALTRRALAATAIRPADTPLQVELQLYRWAAGEEGERAEARAATERLIAEGARSEGWDFEPVLAIARREQRADIAALEAAAATISGPS